MRITASMFLSVKKLKERKGNVIWKDKQDCSKQVRSGICIFAVYFIIDDCLLYIRVYWFQVMKN